MAKDVVVYEETEDQHLDPDTYIFLRQPYETDLGWHIFSNYYLPLKHKRSVASAYRSFLMHEKGYHLEDALKAQTRGDIANEANGKDINGFPLAERALTWQERAIAYDKASREVYEAKIRRKREELYEQEQQDYHELAETFREANRRYREHLENKKELDSEDFNNLQKLVKTRESIQQGQRNALGMPQTKDEQLLTIEIDEDDIDFQLEEKN